MTAVAFSPDGRTLAVSSGVLYHMDLHVFDVATGKLLGQPLQNVDSIAYQLLYTADGKRLIANFWNTIYLLSIMRPNSCPEFIKLEILSIPPLSWTLEFKRDENGIYEVLAFHHGLGMSISEVHRGHASKEHVTALNGALQAIQLCPQSGNKRVIADGNQIEVRTPSDHFTFFTAEEGDNGEAFQHCLRLACSAVLDASTYQRWKLDTI